jgi:hypothetical protein
MYEFPLKADPGLSRLPPMPQRRTTSLRTMAALLSLMMLPVPTLCAQAVQSFQTPQQLVTAMLEHENSAHHDRYEYLADERSERTGGHLWTERIVEIPAGRVRLLLDEDGKPISPDRVSAERARLAAIAADPAAFERAEASQKSDEEHARQMLNLLPRAFLLDNVRLDGRTWRMDFHPNPEYSPSGLEERVLHGMSGTVAIDAADLRLVHIDGHLSQDVSIGFGILATIKAGSHFSSDREKIEDHWRTVHVVTDIRGKAALFKTVAKNSEVIRSEFRYLPADVTPVQAVALVQQ